MGPVKMKSFFIICFLFFVISGCSVLKQAPELAENDNQRGMKLWEQNCTRCHNSPDPAMLTDSEWDVVGAHMRVRAYLTQGEEEHIIKFLKTIN